jgi:hypothetical protein
MGGGYTRVVRSAFPAVCWLLSCGLGCSGATSQAPPGASGSSAAGATGAAGSSAAGGAEAGGSATGGAEAGGVPAAGANAGGTPAGGSSAGGSSAGGSTAGAAAAGAASVACDCVAADLRWRRDGGLVAQVEASSVSSCNSFRHESGPAGKSPTEVCDSLLVGCGNSIGVGDLNASLNNADVQAALQAAPVLYGGDPRPVDGQVEHLEIGGKVIEVGGACGQNGGSGCLPIPDGVAGLVAVLRALEMQQKPRGNCTTK